MPALFVGISAAILIAYAAVKMVSRRQKAAIGRTWDCGSDLTPRMEITATAFSRSIITVFKNILRPVAHMTTEYIDSKGKYFQKTSTVTLELHDVYRENIYSKVNRGFAALSDLVKKIQTGNINVYIFYLFAALVGLLISLAV